MDTTNQAAYVFDKNAERYQDKFMNLDLYNDGFDLFCADLNKQNATILDIGCGPGNITKYLLKKRPDFKILGIDVAPKMIALARSNNPDADFQLMDCREINKLESRYDGVMCGFCFPYLSKEEALQLIANAVTILNSNGLLYISTMEDDYDKSGVQTSSNGEDKIFMYYHQEDYLKTTLLQNNFAILDIKHQSFPTQDGSTVTDMIIIGRLKS